MFCAKDWIIRGVAATFVVCGLIYGEPSCLENQGFSLPGCCCKPMRMKLTADALFWRAIEEGSDCGSCSEGTNPSWNGGYRVEGCLYSRCSPYRTIFSWTHYQVNDSYGCSEGCRGLWKLRYEALDALLQREICLDSCFILKPFGGVRASRIRENTFSRCEEETITELDTFDVIKERSGKIDFNGLGPLVGVSLEYKYKSCISFYGTLSTGLLYGNYRSIDGGIDTFTNPVQTFVCENKRNREITQHFVDGAVGIRWERCFCNNLRLFCQLGLEHHCYFRFNRSGFFGDLYFDGVNFSLGAGF